MKSVQSSVDIIGANEDLLTEILMLLPAKSVIRFKLVSKRWHSAITAAITAVGFRHRHLLNHRHRRAETQHSFILRVQDRSEYYLCHPTIKKLVPLSLPCTLPHVKILQSCHGLLLLECPRKFFVFNPVTRQLRNIYIDKDDSVAAFSLIFDPSISEYYKVVGIWRNCTMVRVYSSDTHEWRSNGELVPSFEGFIFEEFRKILSWKNGVYFERRMRPSVYYCLDEGKRHNISSTRGALHFYTTWSKYVMESNGHLHCLILSFHPTIKPNSFIVAEMVDTKEWSTCKETNWYQLKQLFYGKQADFVGMIREERVEDSMLLLHVPGKIMLSTFGEEFEVLVDFTNENFYNKWKGQLMFRLKDVRPFIESFAAV